MKNVFMAVVIFICSALCGMGGFCQDYAESEGSAEQFESQLGQNLESEIMSDKTEDEAEVAKMDASMNSGTRPY